MNFAQQIPLDPFPFGGRPRRVIGIAFDGRNQGRDIVDLVGGLRNLPEKVFPARTRRTDRRAQPVVFRVVDLTHFGVPALDRSRQKIPLTLRIVAVERFAKLILFFVHASEDMTARGGTELQDVLDGAPMIDGDFLSSRNRFVVIIILEQLLEFILVFHQLPQVSGPNGPHLV